MAIVEIVAVSAEKRVGQGFVVEGLININILCDGRVVYGKRMNLLWEARACLLCGHQIATGGTHRECFENFTKKHEWALRSLIHQVPASYLSNLGC